MTATGEIARPPMGRSKCPLAVSSVSISSSMPVYPGARKPPAGISPPHPCNPTSRKPGDPASFSGTEPKMRSASHRLRVRPG